MLSLLEARIRAENRSRHRRAAWTCGRGGICGSICITLALSSLALSYLALSPLALSSVAHAQRLPIDRLTVDHGLPNSHIVDLAQDSAGRLWILDRRGLTYYDGFSFHSFPQPEGLLPTTFGVLEIDSEGDIWVSYGRSTRVFQRQGDHWRPLPAPPPGTVTESPTFLSILRHSMGAEIVSATANGIWIWHQSKDGAFSAPERPRGNKVSKVWAMTPFGDKLAIGSADGLCFLDIDHRMDCRPIGPEPRLRPPIYGLAKEPMAGGNDRLWMLIGPEENAGDSVEVVSACLAYLQDGELVVVAEYSAFPALAVYLRQAGHAKTHMLVDSAGGVYLGSSAALYYFDPSDSSLAEVGMKQGLPSTGAVSLLLDREHGVWVGTPRGLSRINSRRFLSFDTSQGLLEDEVTSIAEPYPGRIVLGHNLGFTVLEGDSVIPVPFDRPRNAVQGHFRIFDLAADPEGNVWAATSSSGLWRLDRELKLIRHLPEVNSTRSLAYDPEGRLWLLALEGLYLQAPEGFKRVYQPPGVNRARWLEFTEDGRFLITTSDGLTLVEPDGRFKELRVAGRESNNLFGAFGGAEGGAWVGSTTGPYLLRGDDLTPVGDGFPDLDRPVYFFLEGPEGRIWLGTDDGLRVWDGSHLRTLSTRHGLISREANRGAGLVDHRGRVWVGTDRGVSVYQPEHDFSLPAPLLDLASLEVDGENHALDRPIRLDHAQNNLKIKFRLSGLSQEETLLTSYKLEGLERFFREPLPAAAREVSYNSLPPGSYRFHIRAGREHGRWTEEVVSPPIVISPPLWRTYPFYAVVLLLTSATAVMLFRLRTRTVRKRALRLQGINQQLRQVAEEKERLIADLEAKNVELERFTYTVSHDLKSPLLNICGFLGYLEESLENRDYEAMKADMEAIDQASQKMVQLLDELLELARVGQSVRPSERIDLSTLIGEILELSTAKLREHGVTPEVHLEVKDVFGDPTRLRMVFQNLLDNAIRFTHRQKSPHIVIRSAREGNDVLISVADNGIGVPQQHQEQIFGLFKRLDPSIPGTGVGLALVRRIVEGHGGEVWVESEGVDQGSKFVVRLPGSMSPQS